MQAYFQNQGRLDLSRPRVGFADLGDTADGHLSRDSEVIAHLALLELLQIDLFYGCGWSVHRGER
jgi:hypothetical protein